MIQLKKNALIYISFFAFIIYQFINFIYFPLATVFPDENRFLQEAIKFSQSGEFWVGKDRAWEMPLTGIFYGVIYKISLTTENTIIIVRVLQSSMLILQAFLIYKISLIIFKNKEMATLSFIGMLFYPFFIYFQGLLLSETIYITILISSFFFIYKWFESDFSSFKYLVLANLLLCLSLYSKGTISYLPPILITLFYFINKINYKSALRVFGISIVIYILVMSFWWIRNHSIFNKFVPFTTSSAMNLYLGANLNNKEGGIDWSKDVEKEFVEKVKSLDDELLKNEAYKEKAIFFIKENPDKYFDLMFLKFKRFYKFGLNATSISSPLKNMILQISFGIFFIFSIFTIILKFKFWKEFSAIFILIGYFTLIHILFIASVRYRLPIDPFFILLAPYSIVFFKGFIFGRKKDNVL